MLLAEKKEREQFQTSPLSWGERARVYHEVCFFLWGMERSHITEYSAENKIPDCPIKIAFLDKVGTAVSSSIKSRFDIMGPQPSDAIQILLRFSSLTE